MRKACRRAHSAGIALILDRPEKIQPAAKAIVFDLGDTLVEYEGVPLSWEAHYDDALRNLALALNATLDAEQLAVGCEVLRRYNTRLNPRETETSFREIVTALLERWRIACDADELTCAKSFFSVFRQRLRAFPDTRPTLARLRAQGLKIAVFTDVPYGMARELVLEDVRDAALEDSIDVLLTSRDAGRRKPAPATLVRVAAELGCGVHELVHIGNERKDIDVARAVGCPSILIDRHARNPDWKQDRTIHTLAEL